MARIFQKIVDSNYFQNVIIGVIFFSSFLIGLETYPALRNNYGHIMWLLEEIVLFIFAVEIIIRVGAYGRKPWRFFQNGWNVFDFVIVALCYLPESQFFVILRMVRIMRIFRLMATVQESELRRQKNIELKAAYERLEEEKAKSERLLLNILPHLIAQRLKEGQKIIADSFTDVTVLFTDIVGFTDMSARITPEQMVNMLDDIFCRFDSLAEKYGLEKIKTIGDAYMVVSGVPRPRPDHLEAIARMSLEMPHQIRDFNDKNGMNLQVRIGFACGPVVAGVIGQKKFIYDLWGDTVNTASRMESHGVPDKIQVPEQTYLRLQDRFIFQERGVITIKGKGEMRTFFLLNEMSN